MTRCSIVQAEGRALLEEWPQQSNKKVAFSTYSHCKVYRINVQIEREKSYTKSDRKKFQEKAFRDCARIRAMMEKCPYDGGHAIRYLMINRLIKPEDLLGIEGLLTGYEKVVYERMKHSALVLKAQKKHRRTYEEDLGAKLASIAQANSSRAGKKAKLRAGLAA